ncbi:MAG: TAXI family TRAP transporter solute-binding subunit [Pseudomonadota bacterium]|nr:TAXI family TRAP transporter solute-binding subunit [Pseudomonadota bacterium]
MFNNKAIEMDEWVTAGPVESRRMAPGYVRRKRARSVIGCLFSMATILLTTGCTENMTANRPYILSTATTGGTYYPVGVALATITKAQLHESEGISLSAISSAGSMENVKLMRDNQAQFAILQGIFAPWALNGEGPISRPQPWLRSICALWRNADHFVLVNKLVKTGTITDISLLDGERFVIGARNSGAEQTGNHILTSLRIPYTERVSLAYMGYGATANAIQDGTIAGMNIPGGPPITAITRAFAMNGEDLTMLTFTDEQLAQVNSQYPLWTRFVIPPDTYPNQPEAVNTIALSNVLAVRDDVPDESVYLVTKAIFENLAALHEIHQATRDVTLESALVGVGVPLHPGAVRYYREQGIHVPPQLLP